MSSFTVLMSRFAPFCAVDLDLVRAALADGRQVIIVITDADLAPSSRLPWTADEREVMCRKALAEFGDQVHFVQIDAQPRPRHALNVLELIGWKGKQIELTPGHFIGIEGVSVAYLRNHQAEEEAALSALYEGDDHALSAAIPASLIEAVTDLRQSPEFPERVEEHRYLEDYKRSWAVTPYPALLVTVDVLIVHYGELLLIERGRVPGKGLWALPGGFVEPDEWLVDAALRELHEETGMCLHDVQVRERLKGSHVFDDPWRSGRGRVITHAFHFELDGIDQPEVSGQDDAASARWVPLDEVKAMRGRFFDDHGRIIAHFLGI